jgi:hypothetical protein
MPFLQCREEHLSRVESYSTEVAREGRDPDSDSITSNSTIRHNDDRVVEEAGGIPTTAKHLKLLRDDFLIL